MIESAIVVGSLVLGLCIYGGLKGININISQIVKASEVEKIEVGEAQQVQGACMVIEGNQAMVSNSNFTSPEIKINKETTDATNN